jgi:acyl carrier protein
MTRDEMIEAIAEVIDTEMELTPETKLDAIDYYDSVAVLSLMSWFDEIGVSVAPKDFEGLETVADLLALAGGNADG